MRADDTLIIVPTRGRPHSVAPLVKAWHDTGARAELLLALDEDDPELQVYLGAIERLSDVHLRDAGRVIVQIESRKRLVGTLNEAATRHAPDYAAIGFMGDDHRPRTKGWDHRFAECLSGGAGIVYGNDLLVGDRFPTAVMMTSDIVQALGYMAPPVFTHLCIDVVWRDWGQGMGRITYLSDVVIEHVHPHAGKAKLDPGYLDVNSAEMVQRDNRAYAVYHDEGNYAADLHKLKELL